MNQELFTRSDNNPILKPVPEHAWESRKLYNPGAVYHNGKHHLFYRAVGEGPDWESVIGYAASDDGERFDRFSSPLLKGEGEFEVRGLEDPRITKIGDTFYMAYAAYDGITPRLSIATSQDLKSWTKHGPALGGWRFAEAGGKFVKFIDDKPAVVPQSNEWSKSGAIFPEKIEGKYVMLFGEYRIWLAYSDDGLNWKGDHTPLVSPRTGSRFDNCYVETGPPPILTEKGWLVFYHGVDNTGQYSLGIILLDFSDPKKVLSRPEKSVFRAARWYESHGLVDILPGGLDAIEKMRPEELEKFVREQEADGIYPRIVFCNGAIVTDDMVRIYYGAGDTVVCAATASLSDLIDFLK